MSLLSCNALSVRKQSSLLIDDVSMHVDSGELVGLIGPNGAGKSTLMDALAGINPKHQGEITLAGKSLDKISALERGRLLAWVEQSGPVEWPLSVHRVVMLGRRPHLGIWQKPGVEDAEAITRALALTDCQHLKDRDVTTLSGGERTRVLLARALATEPRVLLADEPVAALDLRHQLQTMDLLRGFSANQKGCLVVLHDLSLAARYCDRLYLLHKGKVVADGRPECVLTADILRSVYAVEVAIGRTTAQAATTLEPVSTDGASSSPVDVPWIVPVSQTKPDSTP